MATSAAYIDLDEAAAPATPAPSKVRLYAKTDGSLYQKDDAGTETGLAGAGGSLGAWTDYTPTWATTGTAPTLGNGTVVGRYKALDSKTYAISIVFTYGSTSATGTGRWSFSLPSGVTSAARAQTTSAAVEDTGTAFFSATGYIAASDTKVTNILVADASGTRYLDNITPMNWANGDKIFINGIIEVA